jgi:kumamolisin
MHTIVNGTAHGAAPYYPQDFANAYNVNPLWKVGYSGSGQHIGIVLWTVSAADSTLQRFKSVTGAAVATVANGKFKVIKVAGGTSIPDDGEADLDIEYTSGLAPGATIDYYEAATDSSGNATDQSLEAALNLAGTDANHNQQIDASWGGCESDSTADADPQTGAAYVCYGAQATCSNIGGTSLAAPLWSGMVAVTNSYLAAQGKTVGFLAPALYRLAGSSPTYAPFNDITSGSNGAYTATPNWDEVTGWGSTNLYNLARDLAAQ